MSLLNAFKAAHVCLRHELWPWKSEIALRFILREQEQRHPRALAKLVAAQSVLSPAIHIILPGFVELLRAAKIQVQETQASRPRLTLSLNLALWKISGLMGATGTWPLPLGLA